MDTKRSQDMWTQNLAKTCGLSQLVDIRKGNNYKENVVWFGEPGPKFRIFLICQSSAINQNPTRSKSLQFFMLLKECNQTIKNSKQGRLKICRWHYTTILSKSKKGLELVSSLHNRGKNKLEIIVISCCNIWPNFILIPT